MATARTHSELHRSVLNQIGGISHWRAADSELATLIVDADRKAVEQLAATVDYTAARLGPLTLTAFATRLLGVEEDIDLHWVAILIQAAADRSGLCAVRDNVQKASTRCVDKGSYELVRHPESHMALLAPLPAATVANLGALGDYKNGSPTTRAKHGEFSADVDAYWAKGVGEVLTCVAQPRQWWTNRTLRGDFGTVCASIAQTLTEHGRETTLLAALVLSASPNHDSRTLNNQAVLIKDDLHTATAAAVALELSTMMPTTTAISTAALIVN